MPKTEQDDDVLILDTERIESVHALAFADDTPDDGSKLAFYDDGFGPLWILIDSISLVGIIRARSFEDAYNIAEDELYSEADVTNWEEEAQSMGFSDVDTFIESAIFQESYGFRPNGCNMKDVHKHGIYQKDLNGDRLCRLTREHVDSYHLRIKKSSFVL